MRPAEPPRPPSIWRRGRHPSKTFCPDVILRLDAGENPGCITAAFPDLATSIPHHPEPSTMMDPGLRGSAPRMAMQDAGAAGSLDQPLETAAR
ncbi:hypothetical protein FF100_13335 [Methylobacterium terricola]|uniref:Uncharacterized protein n=1 Tax=Methylobacterium terricola TaxID=2583531 RepID=A0A5C4LI03_9HYPH|nr:hypothetical protein [Methylobacterium terricola]TNC13736.1 hypothetical protein FF100_13335 [Methylobacterium terricola]